MSNALSDVRDRLKAVLEGVGLHAFAVVPPKVTPPFAYVAPGDPYVTYEGANFGGEIVTCNVGAVVAAGANDVTAEGLDDAVLLILDALLDSDDFTGLDVEVGAITVNGQSYLGASIRVQTEIHRH